MTARKQGTETKNKREPTREAGQSPSLHGDFLVAILVGILDPEQLVLGAPHQIGAHCRRHTQITHAAVRSTRSTGPEEEEEGEMRHTVQNPSAPTPYIGPLPSG